jgi:hypothetical protein
MPEVNYEWVKQQLTEAGVKIGAGNAVLKLLETWEEMPLSEKMSKDVINVFCKLALSTAIIAPEDSATEEVWVQAQPGQINVGDEVRVLLDAFSDKTGVLHNGRRGKVIAIRYGDVIFKSTDGKKPDLSGTHYSPYKLEKRVK